MLTQQGALGWPLLPPTQEPEGAGTVPGYVISRWSASFLALGLHHVAGVGGWEPHLRSSYCKGNSNPIRWEEGKVFTGPRQNSPSPTQVRACGEIAGLSASLISCLEPGGEDSLNQSLRKVPSPSDHCLTPPFVVGTRVVPAR